MPSIFFLMATSSLTRITTLMKSFTKAVATIMDGRVKDGKAVYPLLCDGHLVLAKSFSL